ncbi:plasmid stability protein [Sphingomonas vulcanisoli]|uniref:Plasmid stability protein n=1 Tax=Sphingomonas vulcanisoli TaxID=1658060 RepID=A0ABX0TNA3_9SPHN|nr:hypothetical protein [Sphingomonas vulcanisoli]NIJ06588.1 plasmid stability protein [Sphingomonas vulcanisoli]
MGQMLIRQLDDAAIERLKLRARRERTSAEALARGAIHREAAQLTLDEKLELVRQMQEKTRRATIPDAVQTSGVDLIREDRDR